MIRRAHGRAALALTLVAATAAVGAAGAGAASKTRTVQVRDSIYTPRKLTVGKGTTVVWNFDGSLPHNVEVTSGPELFSSSIFKHGTFKRKLRKTHYKVTARY